MVITIYSVWVSLYVGYRMGWRNELWITMLLLSVMAGAMAGPVTASHGKEPVVVGVPWHRQRVWSLHEDFHLALAAADVAWLLLALDVA